MKNLTTKTVLLFLTIMWCMATSHAQQVVINEINYRSEAVQEKIEFIELYNKELVSVDLSGWYIEGLDYTIPASTIIPAGGYAVIAGNATDLSNKFSIPANALVIGNFTGKLSNDGEEFQLRNANYFCLEKIEYDGWKEWPAVRYINAGATIVSIQKLHPDLPGEYAGSWGAGIPTPGAANSAVLISNPTDIPVINRVSRAPDKPLSSEPVKIEAELENLLNLSGSLTVTLDYQIVGAGSYIRKSSSAYATSWTSIAMTDDGIGADANAENGVFTAEVPAQSHRTLVRYRIRIETSTGYNKLFPDQNHNENNYAYFVDDGQANFNGYQIDQLSPLQSIHLLATAGHVNSYIDNNTYTLDDYPGEGTLVYNGKVYDHIGFRARGKNSRHARIKKNLKFDLNKEHPIEVENDYGKNYKAKRSKLALSGTWVNDANGHGLAESLVYKITELTGGLNKFADYCQLKIVDNPIEGGNTGDFRGIYLVLEDYNGNMLEEHDLPDGNIYTYKPFDLSHEGENGPFGVNNSEYTAWNTGMGDSQNGCANCTVPTQAQSWYQANLDLDQYYADWVMNELMAATDTNYPGQHSYWEYYNPETQKWTIVSTDYDIMFGQSQSAEQVVYYRSGTNVGAQADGPLKPQLLTYNVFKKAFTNKLRNTIDLLMNAEQLDHLLGSETAKIYDASNAFNWTDLDKSRWGGITDIYGVQMDYTNYNTDVISWYRNWFQSRANELLTQSDQFNYTSIPSKPSITYTGAGAYPLDGLSFTNSAFVDNGTFAAMEWRVGEWSNPANPIYDQTKAPIYEIQDKWSSGEITSFGSNYTIPVTAKLEVGKSYKVRVRYKDNNSHWSHWSEAVSFVPTAAVNAPTPKIVINEISYNPSKDCGNEYLELINAENYNVDISSYTFTDGLEYTFPANTIIGAGNTIVIARDSTSFVEKYGFSPFADYSGSLDNEGERLELRGWYDVIIDSITYNQKNPWDEAADGDGYSLELLNPLSDNNDFINWFRSDIFCGTPGAANSRLCTGIAEPIVINEINYNSDNGNFDPGDWVELYNPNSTAVDISGWSFYDNAYEFVVPPGTIIAADDYLILTENSAVFGGLFPHLSSNQYIGNFSFTLGNSGERVSLFNPDKCLSDYVVYNDVAPWDTIPDGNGPTLSLIAPNQDNALPASWESSSNISSANGTPGRENTPCPVQQIVAPDTLCAGDVFTLMPDFFPDNTSYQWFLSGTSIGFALTDSVAVSWANAGTYTIQLAATFAECTKIYNKQIVVDFCNTAPATQIDSYSIAEDNMLNSNTSLIANDMDPEGDNLIVNGTPVTPPSNGTLTLNADGTFTYLPNPNFYGNDTFEYEVCDDGIPIECSTSFVYVEITPVSDAPIAVDDNETLNEDTSFTGNMGANDIEVDGESLIINSVPATNPLNGSLFILTSGFWAYTPDSDFNGTDSFDYVVCDTGSPSLCDTARVFINVLPVNDMPEAVVDTLYGPADSLLVGNVLQNDIDVDGDVLTANTNIIGNPANGTVSIQANGDVIYTPNAGFSGTDQFTYEACDPDGLCSIADVVLVVELSCVDIQLSVWLEGAYDENIFAMRNDLNVLRGLLPGQTPVSALAIATPAGQPYNMPPWDYSGTEAADWTDADYTDDVVDWILVSFRTDITKNTQIAQAAGLLYEDGSIEFPNRCVLPGETGSVYIVIEHRNHMGIMSSSPVDIVNGVLMYDFRTTDTYKDVTSYGQVQLPTGEWAMFAGDGDQVNDVMSYDILGTDKAVWLLENGVFNQYLNVDYNLDGDVSGADKTFWDKNNGISSRVPK